MSSVWSGILGPAQRRFRRERARTILEHMPSIRGSVVLDLGGSIRFWDLVDDILQPERVLIFNIGDSLYRENVDSDRGERFQLHLYDGSNLPLDDGSVDVVLSNSVIEHVPPASRAALAAEMRRVGRHFVVQTPSPAFPMEPHFLLPFLHWLPRPVGRLLAPLSPFALLTDVDSRRYFDETALLSPAELQGYFPGGRIVTERVLGIPKSNLIIG